MTPSLEEWPTKAKEAPSAHEVRLALLDTNPVFQTSNNLKSKITSNNLKNKIFYNRKIQLWHKFYMHQVFWRSPSVFWLSFVRSIYIQCSKSSSVPGSTNYLDLFMTFFLHLSYRSRRPEMFCKKGDLRNFATFTGKQLCQSFFFNKVEHL